MHYIPLPTLRCIAQVKQYTEAEKKYDFTTIPHHQSQNISLSGVVNEGGHCICMEDNCAVV